MNCPMCNSATVSGHSPKPGWSYYSCPASGCPWYAWVPAGATSITYVFGAAASHAPPPGCAPSTGTLAPSVPLPAPVFVAPPSFGRIMRAVDPEAARPRAERIGPPTVDTLNVHSQRLALAGDRYVCRYVPRYFARIYRADAKGQPVGEEVAGGDVTVADAIAELERMAAGGRL